jgi:hypothetical protein
LILWQVNLIRRPGGWNRRTGRTPEGECEPETGFAAGSAFADFSDWENLTVTASGGR